MMMMMMYDDGMGGSTNETHRRRQLHKMKLNARIRLREWMNQKGL